MAKRVPMSWWEVAEMAYERRRGLPWRTIGWRHGVSCHKARREVERFERLAREKGVLA